MERSIIIYLKLSNFYGDTVKKSSLNEDFANSIISCFKMIS
jgi:hypothetical protein